MPVYVYKCPKCEQKFDISHPMNDKPTILCPDCSLPANKLPGVGAVTFNGSGWGHQ